MEPIQERDPEAASIPSENQAELAFAAQYKVHHGPLPPAQELRAYGEIDLEIPNRIIAMAEKEQEFRQATITERDKIEASTVKRAQYFTLLIVVIAMVAAVILGIWGDKYVAGVLGASAIFGPTLAAAFRALSGPPRE